MQPSNPERPPRNRDQEIPKREGDDMAKTATDERSRDRDRNAPVPSRGDGYARGRVRNRTGGRTGPGVNETRSVAPRPGVQ